MDLSPISYTLWNENLFKSIFPQNVTLGDGEHRISVYGHAHHKFRALSSKQIFSLFIDMINSPQPLHPNTNVDSSHCVAMMTDLVKKPVWIQIPCNEPLLTHWVCKAKIPGRNVNLTDTNMFESAECQPGQYRCRDGECITEVYVCDGETDCTTGEDELNCELCHDEDMNYFDVDFCRSLCQLNDKCICHFLYDEAHSGGCVPYVVPILNQGHNFTYRCQDGIENHFNHSCFYDLDINGRLMFCSSLQFCETANCSNTYKCPGSYCIPYRRVCDGKQDCNNGEDEVNCDNHIFEEVHQVGNYNPI